MVPKTVQNVTMTSPQQPEEQAYNNHQPNNNKEKVADTFIDDYMLLDHIMEEFVDYIAPDIVDKRSNNHP
jgi:hypothetical protein